MENEGYELVEEDEEIPAEILANISDFEEAVNNDSYSVDFSELDAFFGLNGEEVSLDSAMGEAYKEQCETIAEFYVDLSWRRQYCGIKTLTKDGVKPTNQPSE